MSNFIVRKAAVLGAGVMGAQIAAHLANAEVPVLLFDLPAREGDTNGIVNRAIDALRKLEPSPLASKDRVAYIDAANYAQHLEQLAGFLHVVLSQGLHIVHVQISHDTDLAAVVGQAILQDAGGAVFQHHGVDLTVHQQSMACSPSGAVGRIDTTCTQEQTAPTGQAHMAATQLQQPGDQTRNGRHALRASHTDDRDAGSVPWLTSTASLTPSPSVSCIRGWVPS